MAADRSVSLAGEAGEHEHALISAAETYGKAVLAGPVFDTIKRVENGLVVETIDRDKLRWPLAWAYTPENVPASDPPPAEWFVGAAVLE
ncbi:MAG TPA: 2-C-methyl-D-erythritol 4-phosphate cytidylyltransferase [Chloroflexota bacterium]|nr:2-C-methyl-D-erythritol 4-phosphate cytidylyltransferase [Chloroflexota bacterium]